MSAEILTNVQEYLPDVSLKVVSQGAEAVVFLADKHPYLPKLLAPADIQNPDHYIIKYRPPKPYRHPVLDTQLTKSRTAAEARLLSRLYQLDIAAPKLVAMDAPHGLIWMEFIGYHLENGDVSSLKNWLWLLEKQQESGNHPENPASGQDVRDVMEGVGRAIGKLHLHDIVHGDLTSSNIILVREETTNIPTLIDFGLSSFSLLAEDKAVDLYVLERALTSTHPVYAASYNQWLLEGYQAIHDETAGGRKKRTEILKRLEGVRLRGRKRSMLG